MHIKLSQYCKNNSISYITGYRWFKDGKIPGAIQMDSGTILIPQEEEKLENSNLDAISLLLTKSQEYAAKNASITEFAAYIVSNFTFELNKEGKK